MTLKEWFIKVLTPKDAEEVKPGLIVQKKKYGYKQIWPGAWNGEVYWTRVLLGPNFFKTSFWFLLIMFMTFAYWHDVKELQGFYEEVKSNYTCTEKGFGKINDSDIFNKYNVYGNTFIGQVQEGIK